MQKRKIYAGIFVLLVLASFSLCGCTGGKAEEGQRISIFEALASPQRHEGERVTIRGVLAEEENGYALYVSHQDVKYAMKLSAIWLGELEGVSKPDREFVAVTGRLSSDGFAGEKEYGCTIKEIESVEKLEVVNEMDARNSRDPLGRFTDEMNAEKRTP